jgi:hypothetical protein
VGVGVGVDGGTKVTQVPATVFVVVAVADGVFVAGPADDMGAGAGLELATGLGALPALALVAPVVELPLARGDGIAPGALEQVLTIVVTGIGFGVGVMFPIGAADPPVDSAGLADGDADVGGAWLGLIIGARLGLVTVVRPAGVMLLWLGVTGVGEGDGVCVGVGVVAGVWARITLTAGKISATLQSRLIWAYSWRATALVIVRKFEAM